MNRMIALILPSLFFLNTTSLGQDKNGDKQIHGTWKVVSVKESGRDEKTKGTSYIITKDTFTIVEGDRRVESLKYRVDPSKNPKWITLTTKRDKSVRGIYDLKGDTLRMCLNEDNDGKRPTRFVSERGTVNDLLIVMRRKK